MSDRVPESDISEAALSRFTPTERLIIRALHKACRCVGGRDIAESAVNINRVAADTGITVGEALAALTLLELKGLVRQFSGKRFALR